MPRPKKCRRICALPGRDRFGPPEPDGQVVMTLDEYEMIRLIDRLDYTQEECAAQMGVARTTVQAVYAAARKKLAEALTEGRSLLIQGGDYSLCPDAEGCCGKSCNKRRCSKQCCKNGGKKDENCGNV